MVFAGNGYDGAATSFVESIGGMVGLASHVRRSSGANPVLYWFLQAPRPHFRPPEGTRKSRQPNGLLRVGATGDRHFLTTFRERGSCGLPLRNPRSSQRI